MCRRYYYENVNSVVVQKCGEDTANDAFFCLPVLLPQVAHPTSKRTVLRRQKALGAALAREEKDKDVQILRLGNNSVFIRVSLKTSFLPSNTID